MIAPKNGRKNPTMGQVDDAVRQAGERQAYEAGGAAYQQPPPPPSEPDREPRAEYAEPSYAQPPLEVAAPSTPGPLAMLAKLASMPWYAWLGVGALGLLIISVVQEERAASSNPDDDDDDLDEDEEGDPEEYADEESDDYPDDDEDDSDVEEELQDDTGEEYDSSDEPRPSVRVKVRRTSRSRATGRVIEDNQPEQEPEESVLG